MNVSLNPQKTPNISPKWTSYGVCFVVILEKIDRITKAHSVFGSLKYYICDYSIVLNSVWHSLPPLKSDPYVIMLISVFVYYLHNS